MRDSPNASEIRFIFEDTSVDVKIYKQTKLAESSDIRFRQTHGFLLKSFVRVHPHYTRVLINP